MGAIIAVVNQKGGVGKTTTAMNLVAYLAAEGKRCLLVDLDPQANATSGLGFAQGVLEQGVYEVLSGALEPRAAVQRAELAGFDILPSTISLAGAAVELVTATQREYRLVQALGALKDDYDFLFIDCPPELGLLTINGLVASDMVLIPVQAEYFALEGLGQLLNTINLVKAHLKPELQILGAVITMYDKRARLSDNILNELYNHFPEKIFRTVIPRTVRLAEAPSYGKSILHYSPASRGAKAYERLAKEFISLDW